MNPSKIFFSLFMLLCATGVFLTGAGKLASNAVFYLNAEHAPATVSVGGNGRPSLVFTDKYGSSHIAEYQSLLAFMLQDKQQVAILYDPRSPNDLTVNSFIFQWGIGFLVSLIGIIFVALTATSIDWASVKGILSGKMAKDDPNEKRQASQAQNVSPGAVSTKQAGSVNLSGRSIE